MLPLTQTEAFPEPHREAVRAVAAAMTASGRNPAHYTAEVLPTARGLLEVYARHHKHIPEAWERGDLCGQCCVATYNPRTRTVSKITGIR